MAPELWREALLRIREMTYAEHELYAQLRLAETLAVSGETADAEVELVPAYQRARSIGRRHWSRRWRLLLAEPG